MPRFRFLQQVKKLKKYHEINALKVKHLTKTLL